MNIRKIFIIFIFLITLFFTRLRMSYHETGKMSPVGVHWWNEYVSAFFGEVFAEDGADVAGSSTTVITQQEPKTYRVWVWQENGDCLWKIAEKFYGDGRKWKIIYEANKDKIQDPGKIYPKQELIIP
ncbi:MAG: LysM peptidoglycan-binding domain-containing protein [Elusimicrobia bacterium]|nr:LysM peptidoglycan-binding domain-containing protein [Elusimicrobiota bacterium]